MRRRIPRGPASCSKLKSAPKSGPSGYFVDCVTPIKGDRTMTRHLPIDDAARVLGVSRKTIERRLKSGTLTGHLDGRRWLVAVPDEVVDPSQGGESQTAPAMSQTRQTPPDMSETVAVLQAEL